jgi:hypothetical protein
LPYSPNLSVYDFSLLQIWKQKIKKRISQNEKQILATITKSWNEFTFEDIQKNFHNWIKRLIWVIANSDKYRVSHSSLSSEDLCGRALALTLYPIEKTFPIIIT